MKRYTVEEILKSKKQGKSLRKADLHGINLTNLDLTGVDFEEANLIGAILNGTILENANLKRANLIAASLVNANLRGADLRKTDFERADLSGANMEKSNPHEADLEGCILKDANLRGANLHEADLKSANLQKADLRDTNLSSAILNNANLTNADITGANIWGIAHVGWQIEGIVADYIYVCEKKLNDSAKQRTRQVFESNGFEELYKSLPTVEMLFTEGLTLEALANLIKMVEVSNNKNPDREMDLQEIKRTVQDVIVKFRIREDKDLPLSATLFAKLLSSTLHQKTSPLLDSPKQKQSQCEPGVLVPQTNKTMTRKVLPMFAKSVIQFNAANGETRWRGRSEELINDIPSLEQRKPSSSDTLFDRYKAYNNECNELLNLIKSKIEENKLPILEELRQALVKKNDNAHGLWRNLEESVESGTEIHHWLMSIFRMLN